MAEKSKLTPIRRQYLEIKAQHPDAILFFRLGDFYETFDHDAEIAARELDIVLTSRNVAKNSRVPMAGIPHHAMENYLSRLIDRGYHVAICEQVGDQPVNGLVPRQVVRVVTPGTVSEPGLLPTTENNYLACAVLVEDRAGVAFVDISTGEFAATEIHGNGFRSALRNEIIRLRPAEILVSEEMGTKLIEGSSAHATAWPGWRFELGRCQEALLRHFQVAALDGFGLRGRALAIRAAGAILQYLQETDAASLRLLSGLRSYQTSEFMTLDAATRRNLELTETIRAGSGRGSLLAVLDRTVTPMGGRLIRQWVSMPLLDVDRIRLRQEAVGFFFRDGLLRKEIRQGLRPLADLERLINRVVSGSAHPRDLVSLRKTLEHLPALKAMLPVGESPISESTRYLHNCAVELKLLDEALTEDPPATLQHIGVIRPGFSAELDGVYEASRHAREWISALEGVERDRLGVKNLKVGYNKVFGYYIEVSKSHVAKVPDSYIRKQTLVNAERYITPELKDYETQVLNAEERIRAIEGRLFQEVCSRLAAGSKRILETARALAELDVISGLAEVAVEGDYQRPEVVEDPILDIREGRHPVVERELVGERFIPNDAIFSPEELVRVITGPNMSGKSTFLRQVALIVLMAQMGSFVPVSAAKIGLVDRIFTRIGAQDEIHAGQSTFMVEMVEMANILHHATPRSLLILDEVGRGTSTYDGVSIAWAVVEYIHNHPDLRAKTLFATHYHELTQLATLLPRVTNFNVAVSEADGQVVFLHRIVPGSTDRSYGIHVAQLAGLPKPVIQRANEILNQLEATSGDAVQLDQNIPRQMALFPTTNPLLDELDELDLNTLSPIEALNILYEWQKRYLEDR